MPPPPAAAATPAIESTPKPILKLNTGHTRQPSLSGDGATPTPSGEKKTIKIKISSSQPGTPSATPILQTPSIHKTKAGRTPKPSAKLTESKKRGYESDEDRPMAAVRAEAARPSKMIKIRPSVKPSTPNSPFAVTTPITGIKFRPKGEPIHRRVGDAYDSEASDRENDPQRESNVILRVMPGEPAEYLRKALADGTMGQPKSAGGADFAVQYLDAKERRAMVTINGVYYAAVLVSLPTVTEAMKTWDRKAMMKNSDITEMLLCYAVVRNEAEAKTAPLPPMVMKDELKWPHGITPPMHDAANRRFRKVLSEKQWQRTQDRVAKLLEDDNAAEETRMEFINDEEGDADYEDDEDADAEGEMEQDDYFGDADADADADVDADADADGDIDNLDLEAALEAELADEPLNMATPGTQLEAATPMTVEANTPMAFQDQPASEEDEDEEEEDVSDEDEDDDDDVDDEHRAAERERKERLSELQNLENQLSSAITQLQQTTMPILKKRISTTIENLKKEIAVKKAGLGMTDED
ncbi:TAFII55 protein conserved region-domain-containing protein [Biscogniauxia mediterranea]|nr:TAFII55 protein conserved region-domain-containing protein [Biscogniauxia mediterranea]